VRSPAQSCAVLVETVRFQVLSLRHYAELRKISLG
jgi:hypothetical protein